MAVSLFVFSQYLDALMLELSPRKRQIFFSRLGKDLAKINAARIKANVSPDGEAFAPRLPQTKLRAKKGKTKAMFQRMGKYIDSKPSSSGLELSFKGFAAKIANVHHFGEEDTPDKKRPTLRIRYKSRQLLGISESDLELIVNRILESISKINI